MFARKLDDDLTVKDQAADKIHEKLSQLRMPAKESEGRNKSRA